MSDKGTKNEIEMLIALRPTWRWERFEKKYPNLKDIDLDQISLEEARDLHSKFISFNGLEDRRLVLRELPATSGDIDRLILEITFLLEESSRKSEYDLDKVKENLNAIDDRLRHLSQDVSQISTALPTLSKTLSEIQAASSKATRRLMYILIAIVAIGFLTYR